MLKYFYKCRIYNKINAQINKEWRIIMDIQQIEIFLKVAKSLNFTKVAREFYTTQPTISRQIRLLENELGINLFVRNNKSVRLTPQGIILQKRFTKIIEQLEIGLRECRDLEYGIEGEIRIGCLESVDPNIYIYPSVYNFHNEYPNIRVSVERRSFSELRQKLNEGKFDIIFTFDFEIENMKDIFYDVYCTIQSGILMSVKNKLASKNELKIEDFKNEIFILPDPVDCPGRKSTLENIFKVYGVICEKYKYVSNLESVVLNVQANEGVAVLDESIEAVRNKKFFEFYRLKNHKDSLNIIYAWKKDNNEILNNFIKKIKA